MQGDETTAHTFAESGPRSLLTDTDRAAVDRTLHSIYELQDLDAFVVAAMRELPPLLESDMAAYNEVNYAERRMMAIIDSPTAQKWYQTHQIVFESMMHQNPLIEHSARTRDEPKKISDFISLDQWHATGIYQSVYGRIGGEYQIAVALPVDDKAIVAFAFNRSESDFTERHREILATLQPHLTQAYENARRHERLKRRVDRSEQVLESLGAGWIDLDADRTIRRASSKALSYLDSFFQGRAVEGGPLPQPLVSWVTQNIEAARTGTPVAPFVVKNETGRLILRFLTSGGDGSCSLLGERSLHNPSHEPLEGLGLTSRQAEVLYWLSQGKTNSEIAIMLKISVRTVIFHVSRILDIFSVSNRTEAANIATSHLVANRQDMTGD